MGCVNSSMNKPPKILRPTPRGKQSNQLVLTELSDLDEDQIFGKPDVHTFVGRQTASNGRFQNKERERIEHTLKLEQKMKNKELKKRQEDRLRENLDLRKTQFQLKKENDIRFKHEQERLTTEAENKTPKIEIATVFQRKPTDKHNSELNPDAENDQPETEAGPPPPRMSQFNLSGVTKTGWDLEEMVVQEVVDDPDPRPPTYRKKDIVPNLIEFALFDKYAVKVPTTARTSVSTLVNNLKTHVENQFQLLRMFYRWITFNISFDVEGYYGETPAMSTDAEQVLQNGKTTSEGYSNLLAAMCRFAGMPVKVIHGLVKGYEYQIGDIINLTDSQITHAWNAVYVNNNWFFIDATWGAGHVDRKRKWHRQFQEFYFIVDPDKMIVDHFPFMDGDLRLSSKWQLLKSPVSANSFSQRLKLERAALDWGVKPVTHTQHHIVTIVREVEIQLQEVDDILEEYTIQFQRKDGSKNLESYYLAYKINERTLKIVVRPPQEIDFMLSIFAKKSLDQKGKAELLVSYILKCAEVQFQLRQFPVNYRIYGVVKNYKDYGFCGDITKCVEYSSNTGEIIMPLKTKRIPQCMTKLEHISEKGDLTSYCLVTGKNKGISIKIRLPFEGYFKFTLFGKQSESGNFRPVATFLIDCNQASHVHCGFPVAFDEALSMQCSLYKPLWKDLPANSTITIIIGCPNLAKVQVLFEPLKKDENDIFEGTITTPAPGQPFTIYGQKELDGPLIGLYHFKIF